MTCGMPETNEHDRRFLCYTISANHTHVIILRMKYSAAVLSNSPMVCLLLLFDLRGDDPLGALEEPGFRGTGGPTAVDDLRTTRLGRRLRWKARVFRYFYWEILM